MGPPTSVLVAVVARADVGGLVGVDGHRLVVVVVVGVVDVHLEKGLGWGDTRPAPRDVKGFFFPKWLAGLLTVPKFCGKVLLKHPDHLPALGVPVTLSAASVPLNSAPAPLKSAPSP